MAAQPEQIINSREESFFIGIFQDNLEKSTFHYHNYYEISFITEGSGRRIVGDSIEEFHPGDLVFLGPNLPHVWIPDKEAIRLSDRTLEMVFLQFTSRVVGSQVLSLPEFRRINRALHYAERGIQIVGDPLNEISRLMLQMPYMNGFDKMIHFFKIMHIIGSSESHIFLASKETVKTKFSTANLRIREIHNFLMNHYMEDIDLKEIANLVHMAEGSLCRFFKMTMGLTIFEYLNSIKIDFATKLLMDPDLSITEVCLDSGFNNLSHFNKQFKLRKGMTPSEYRRQFKRLID